MAKKGKPRGRNGGRKPLFDEPSSRRFVTLPDRVWAALEERDDNVGVAIVRILDGRRKRRRT